MRLLSKKTLCLAGLLLATPLFILAQTVTHYTTTDKEIWKTERVRLAAKPTADVVISATTADKGTPFHAWGTTFNELDFDAFNLLSRDDQDRLMSDIFSPDGDLKFTHGRVSMNANDYARNWYSCSEVEGDFELRYFNIDRDRRNIIPLARAAQKYYPALQLFMSPWSPPTWMKINQDYCVLSRETNKQDPRKDYLLYMDKDAAVDPDEMQLLGNRNGVFPRRLATQDYFIQDPRYLQCYADMFCRFIDLYKAEGLPITKVMYQNEA